MQNISSSASDHCTAEAAKKVAYEIQMFRFLCEKLAGLHAESSEFSPGSIHLLGTGDSKHDGAITSALLEALLLHTRVLQEFFYKKATHVDDLIASDFVSNWESLCPREDAYLGNLDRKRRLNKALAHLTVSRVAYDSNEKKWDVRAIRDAIENVWKQFFDILPAERKSWFNFAE